MKFILNFFQFVKINDIIIYYKVSFMARAGLSMRTGSIYLSACVGKYQERLL